MARRILVVEDNPDLADLLLMHLGEAGYAVQKAGDGRTALTRFEEESFDLVILDLMLPDLDGLEICRRLRARPDYLPILMLTAKSTEFDRVLGLEVGADDYLTKPFAFEELLARVRALLRRGSVSGPAVLAVADLKLDPVSREVTRGGKRIDLTPKEFALLEFLLRRREHILSRAVIAQHVWGVDYDTFTNVIDVYVNYLRKKIDGDSDVKLIHTVRGVGYVLKEDTEQ